MQSQLPLTSVRVMVEKQLQVFDGQAFQLCDYRAPEFLLLYANTSAVCLKHARFTWGVPETLPNTTGLHQLFPWYSSGNSHTLITGLPSISISASSTKHSSPPSAGCQSRHRAGAPHSSMQLCKTVFVLSRVTANHMLSAICLGDTLLPQHCGPVRQGSEQSDLIENVPAHCRGVGLDDL